ncbi:MAG: DUF4062 domain-containing protein [Actinobacteria bacterium]|nr:DUF4062 domain-containing protein [Actinomycetota bacterium]
MAAAGRTFRVFISSTFSDLKAERDALQQRVFPRLAEMCLARGARFQAIDLRWGVSEEASLDHRAMDICLSEIARCQALSPRPNFVALLGDRYGWRPLPAEIPATEYRQIHERLAATAAGGLLEEWYRPDTNRGTEGDPAPGGAFVLRARTGRFEDYEVWRSDVEAPLQRALEEAVGDLGLPDAAVLKYTASATHQEIVRGALDAPGAAGHVFGFFRTLEGDPPPAARSTFFDSDDHGAIDGNARRKLDGLKASLRERLPGNVEEYRTGWSGDEPSTEHLEQLCEDVHGRLAGVIERELDRLEAEDPVTSEASAHEDFAAERSAGFVGRVGELSRLVESLDLRSGSPLVVTGPGGSGKSAFMARAAASAAAAHPEAVVVKRFVGATPSSADGRSLLESICVEITRAYGLDEEGVPRDYPRLQSDFGERLRLAGPDRPLLVFVDGLDQLSREDPAAGLGWVPAVLPDHAWVVVSTLSGDPLAALGAAVPGAPSIELGPLGDGDASALLEQGLGAAGRSLGSDQREAVNACLEANRLPLYLRLLTREVIGWRSYTPVPDLPTDTAGMVRYLLQRTGDESAHGPVLVSRTLGLLVASADGLAEDELLDLLSADPEVMAEFRRRAPQSPASGRLPTVIWSRLRADLESFLLEHRSDGVVLLRLLHRIFDEVVESSYLQGEAGTARRRQLAEYFWQQPTERTAEGTSTPNLRRFSELPHQLLVLQDVDRLARLADDGFLEAKARATGVSAAVRDAERFATTIARAGARPWAGLEPSATAFAALLAQIQGDPTRLQDLAGMGDTRGLDAAIERESDPQLREHLRLAAGWLLVAAGYGTAGRKMIQTAMSRPQAFAEPEDLQRSYDDRRNLRDLGEVLLRKSRTPSAAPTDRRPQQYPPAPPPYRSDAAPRTTVPGLRVASMILARRDGTGLLAAAAVAGPLALLWWAGLIPLSALISIPAAITAVIALAWLYLRTTPTENGRLVRGLIAGYQDAEPADRGAILSRILRFQDLIEGSGVPVTWADDLRRFICHSLDDALESEEAAATLRLLTTLASGGTAYRTSGAYRREDLVAALRRQDPARLEELLPGWGGIASPAVEVLIQVSDLVCIPEVPARMIRGERDQLDRIPPACLARAMVQVYGELRRTADRSPAARFRRAAERIRRFRNRPRAKTTAMSRTDRVVTALVSGTMILYLVLAVLISAPFAAAMAVFGAGVVMYSYGGAFTGRFSTSVLERGAEAWMFTADPFTAGEDAALARRLVEGAGDRSAGAGQLNLSEIPERRLRRVLRRMTRSGTAPPWNLLVLRTMHHRAVLRPVLGVPPEDRSDVPSRPVSAAGMLRQEARARPLGLVNGLVTSLLVTSALMWVWAEALWWLGTRSGDTDRLLGSTRGEWLVAGFAIGAVFVVIQHLNLPQRVRGSRRFHFMMAKAFILCVISGTYPYLLFGGGAISHLLVPDAVIRWRGARLMYPSRRQLWWGRMLLVPIVVVVGVLLALIAWLLPTAVPTVG